jgi:esterase/lipase
MSGIAGAMTPPIAQSGASNAAAPDGVFLIHGLGGTQYDLGSMHKRLKNAGLVTHSLTLPGHGTKPEDLADVTAEQWIDAVIAKYREVRDLHPRLHLMGMCMGSLLAAVVAQQEKHASGSLVLLAPPVYIDGWATPWYRVLRPAAVLGARHPHDEDRGRGPVRNQERAATRDRQGQVRAG